MNNLIGDWKFEGSTLTDSLGNPLDDPMNKGSGLLIYSVNGYMAVQLGTTVAASNNNGVNLTSTYIAYYSKYTIDEVKQQVTHYVIDSNIPALVGAKVSRKFIIEASGLMSLQNVEPETFGVDRPIFRKLFWRLISR